MRGAVACTTARRLMVNNRQGRSFARVSGNFQGVECSKDARDVNWGDQLIERKCLFRSQTSKEVGHIILLKYLVV
jgi:hypothetical protein